MIKFGAVNVHGSLLPLYRGAAPIQRSLQNGDTVTGVSLQKMVFKLDAGPVIAEKKIDLDTDINATELYQKGIEKGISFAAINLATIYRDKNEFEKAFELYQVAQKLGKTNLIELAYCYHYGIGTKQNKYLALEIFQKIVNDNSENRNCEFEIENANYYI